MRVKLQLELNNTKRKICLLVDHEKYRKVSDLCHMIFEQYIKDGCSSSYGKVSLFLDGFYISHNESISILQHDDVITARYEEMKSQITQGMRNRKKPSSSDSSSSSSSSEDEIQTVKKRKISLKTNNKVPIANNILPSKTIPPIQNKTFKVTKPIYSTNNKHDLLNKPDNSKRKIPLSQVVVQIEDDSSSSSSSSTSSSDSDTSTNENTKTLIKPQAIKEISTKTIKPNNKPSNQGPVKTLQNNKKSSSSSSSSSSSDSSSDSSDDEKTEKHVTTNNSNNESKDSNVTRTKSVHFNVSKLPKGSTSTPATNNGKTTSNNFHKKDIYKNTSIVIVNDTDKNISTDLSTEKNVSSDQTTLIPLSSLKASPDVFTSNEPKVSSKTLRNKRRRQKKIALRKAAQEESKKLLNGNYESVDTEKSNTSDKEQKGGKDTNGEGINETTVTTQLDDSETGVTQDFTKYSQLTTLPHVDDVIAYKVLEMSLSYTPEVSSYKKASVVKVDREKNGLTLKLFKEYIAVSKGDGTGSRRFEFDDDTTITLGDENAHLQSSEIVQLNWCDLIEPVLVAKNSRQSEE